MSLLYMWRMIRSDGAAEKYGCISRMICSSFVDPLNPYSFPMMQRGVAMLHGTVSWSSSCVVVCEDWVFQKVMVMVC